MRDHVQMIAMHLHTPTQTHKHTLTLAHIHARAHKLIYAYAHVLAYTRARTRDAHPHPHPPPHSPPLLPPPRAAYALIAIPILFGVQVPGFEGEFGNLNSASAVTVEVLNPVYALSDPLEPNNCEIQIS